MCYDVSFEVSNVRSLEDYFPGLVFDDQISIRFEATVHIMGHAYGNHPIIYTNREDWKPHCRLMEWGCIPFYTKDEKAFLRQRASMLNARSERVVDDPKSYWFKIRNRRCLIPVTGIYEHRGVKGWKKKVPYFVRQKGQEIFFLPGLYSVAELPDTSTGELIKRYTYTLITREANSVMAMIHNDGDNSFRMPLFLTTDLAKQWLTEGLTDVQIKEIMAFEMPSEDLEYWTVDTIRSPKQRADGKNKNEVFEWEKLPALGEMNP